MDRQIEELINHELEMQNKKPIAFAPHTSDEEGTDSQEKDDIYQMVVVKGAGGGMK